MGYGDGYYDKCCCRMCKTSCGQVTFGIVFVIMIIMTGVTQNWLSLVLDIGLVIYLFTSYKRRDDDYGIKGVNTAKGCFIYSLVLCILTALGQIIIAIVVIASYYVEEEIALVFMALCWGTTLRVW